MTVHIEEIIDRSAHGQTEPFICRGDDGNIYYVKGRSAGRDSQIKEYICGHLAKALGLPIAPFALVDVPPQLIAYGGRADLHDLGSGLAFGSQRRVSTTEITYEQCRQVPDELARKVLVFDWWIRNADRSLTQHGGNPNLLWDQDAEGLVIIDHNLAFDPRFDARDFAETHIFQAHIPAVFDDMVERSQYQSWLTQAFAVYSSTCDNLPEDWLAEAPAWFSLHALANTLGRVSRDGFWTVG